VHQRFANQKARQFHGIRGQVGAPKAPDAPPLPTCSRV
jgi:hypothetical protein